MAEINLKLLVPEIFIDRIVLESKPMEIKEYNPYIDHEREPNIYRDPETGKLKREEINVDLTKKSTDSTPLIVTINFILKEKMGNDIISSWFDLKNNRELLKYFKVKIIQSLDEDFTNKILQADSLLKVEAPKEVVSRNILIGKSIINKGSTDYYMMVKENDVREYDITFSETFILKNPNPKHLAYFSVCFLDLDDLMKDYGLEGISDSFRMLQGRVNAELIIKEYELFSNTFVFVDDENEIWAGQVTKIIEDREIKSGDKLITVEKNVKWVAGDGKDPNIKYLDLKMIPNTKIQDFRHVKELEKNIVDFSILNNSLMNKVEGNLMMPSSGDVILDINKSKAYFSELKLSRDKQGRARFLFGIDMLSIARDNTLYGKLFRDNNEELLNYIKIRNAKIKRYRISNNNNAIKNKIGIAFFDSNESYELIAVSGEKDTFNFLVGSLSNGTLREIKLDIEPGIRFFTGIDKSISSVTFGLYQYSIEIEVEDKTVDYLKNASNTLLNSYEVLKTYYEEGKEKNNYDVIANRFTQNFIEKQEDFYKDNVENSPWSLSISSYLGILNILIENFDVKRYINNLLVCIHPRTGTLDGISLMLKMMENLLMKLVSFVDIKSTHSLRNRISLNNTANNSVLKNKNIMSLRKIILEKVFNETFFDSDVPKNIGYDFLSKDEFYKELNEDGLTVIHNIDYENRANNETLKYFKDIDSDINLKSNFNNITVDDKIIDNKYRYLTPSIIDLKSETKINLLNKGAGLFNKEQSELFSTIGMSFNFYKKSPRLPIPSVGINSISKLDTKTQVVKTNLTNIVSNLGVSVTPIEKTSIMESKDMFVKTEEMVGTGSLFQKEVITHEQFVSNGSLSSKETVSSINPNSLLMNILYPEITKGMNNPVAAVNLSKTIENNVKTDINVFNLNNENNIVDSMKIDKNVIKLSEQISKQGKVVQLSPSNIIKSLPNQIKSIMIASTNPNQCLYNWFSKDINVLKDSSTNLSFKMNYHIINEVEVFDGFEKEIVKNSQRQMKKEMWIPLTPEKFQESYNKNLLCRMKKYNNKQFGVERPEGIELPTYNEYFILSPINKIFDSTTIFNPSNFKIQSIKLNLKQIEQYIPIINKQYANSLIYTNDFIDTSKIAQFDNTKETKQNLTNLERK